MTTHDYELLDQDPAELAAAICADPATATASLDDDTLRAMLQWAQHGQDASVYRACYDETHRRIRDQLAQETAQYIADALIPESDRVHAFDNVTVSYPGGRRPPCDVPSIKAALLNGECWISWMNDRVLSAMRLIHAA